MFGLLLIAALTAAHPAAAEEAFFAPLAEMSGDVTIIRDSASIEFTRGTRTLHLIFKAAAPRNEFVVKNRTLPKLSGNRWGYEDEIVYERTPSGAVFGIIERGLVKEPDAVRRLHERWLAGFNAAQTDSFSFITNARIELDSASDMSSRFALLTSLSHLLPSGRNMFVTITGGGGEIGVRAVSVSLPGPVMTQVRMTVRPQLPETETRVVNRREWAGDMKHFVFESSDVIVDVLVTPGEAISEESVAAFTRFISEKSRLAPRERTTRTPLP